MKIFIIKLKFWDHNFFNQNIVANALEKNTPSTIANAINLYPNELSDSIHFLPHSVISFTESIVFIALNNVSFSTGSLIMLSKLS